MQVAPNPAKNGEIDIESGKAAGRDCALTTLAVLKQALGSLDRVVSLTLSFGESLWRMSRFGMPNPLPSLFVSWVGLLLSPSVLAHKDVTIIVELAC